MQNKKSFLSKSGFSLVEVNEVDENGILLSRFYEVVDPKNKVIERFGSLEEAKAFLKTVLPTEPPRPCGLGT